MLHVPPSAWPTRRDLDLLRAALGTDAAGAAAWVRPDGDTFESARLRPLLGWNLAQLGIAVPPALQQALRDAWAANQSLVEAAAPVLDGLRRSGVPLVLLKGAALWSAKIYPHGALRPIGDIDVLIGPSALAAARADLSRFGFREVSPMPASAGPHLHSFGFEREDGLQVDLHAYALRENCGPGIDEGFLRRLLPGQFGGVPVFVLSPADQLLQVCAHGLRWSSRPAVHWIADAAQILRHAGQAIDWKTLVREAEVRQLTITARRALGLLRHEIGAPVPDTVLAALAAKRTGLRQLLEYHARLHRPSLVRGLFLHWCSLSRLETRASLPARIARFPGFLRQMWGLPTPWALPRAAARKSVARLRGARS